MTYSIERLHSYIHTHTHIHTYIQKIFQAAKKLQPKVGLAGYGILFAHFIVEAKSRKVESSKDLKKILTESKRDDYNKEDE